MNKWLTASEIIERRSLRKETARKKRARHAAEVKSEPGAPRVHRPRPGTIPAGDGVLDLTARQTDSYAVGLLRAILRGNDEEMFAAMRQGEALLRRLDAKS